MIKDGIDMANYIIQLFGGVDKFLSALIVFMVINYIAEILLVIVSNVVGTIIESNCAIRTTVILFYISNEGLAILKNINRLGVPLPQVLVEMLNRISDRE